MSAVIGRSRIDLREPPCGDDALQLAITLADGTVLGQNLFRLIGFKGQEQVNAPFSFQLQLHANTDPAATRQIDFDQIMGRPVTFAVRRPLDPDATPIPFLTALAQGGSAQWSFFNGIAVSFAMAEPGVYNLTVKAALFKLSLSNNYRIHPQCNIRDAIAGVLDQHKVAYDMSTLEGDDNPAVWRVQDWLQAGESDLAFVQRLMGKAQLYFYFLQSARGHVAVFANRPHYAKVYPDNRPLRYTMSNIEALGLDQDDLITQYSYEQTLTTSTIHGRFVRQHAAWEAPFYPPEYASVQATQPEGDDDLPFHQYKIFQYGCNQEEVTRFTGNAADALATSGTSLSGASSCDRMRVGHTFTLTGSLIAPSNPSPVRPSLEGRSFVLTQVQHEASLDGKYSNQFQSTEETGLVTPFDIQDTHQGSLLAQVVAHQPVEGSGRWEYDYKGDFDLARHTFEDTCSGDRLDAKGVYVSFSTDGGGAATFVKLAPSMQTIPEVGAIVLVGRSSDESELPEIQQILHSFGSKVVTPPGWTSNTQVGNNDSTSYGDSRALRYGMNSNVSTGDVDAAWGKVSGAYDSGKFKDASYSRGAGWNYSTSENGRHAILSESYSYGNTYSTSEADESKVWSDTGYNYREDKVGTSESLSTTGTETRTSTTGTSTTTSTVGTSTSTSTTGTNTNTSITGMSSNTSVTGMHTEVSATGMSTSSSITGISQGMSLTGMQNRMEMTGISSSFGLTGISTGFNLTGMSDSAAITGASSELRVTGASDSIGVTGMSTGINVTGVSTNIGVTGANTSISVTGDSTDIGVVGSTTRINVTGSSTGINVIGSSTDITLAGDTTSITLSGVSNNINLWGSGVQCQEKVAQLEAILSGLSTDLVGALKIVL
ncbi:MAG: hypothetical protein COX57_02870 [Alphaproteobacteria bacterium CG_4_10_14_0_2_um_filter_63_37]|nr:MAG: hypothetical protein AUJ55_03340 [Proteobacteria bacterium CG1_02_64_396]PJA25486.1 MAG: hypothetical protein COX57_02870 [Alphaproteobacteria bacterium CG_4_10_14_0_2_um_filter_63_37]